MDITVLIEPRSSGGFLARIGDPLSLSAEGETPDSAMSNLRDLISERVASGAILMSLHVPTKETPTIHPGAGMYRDEPLFDQWRTEIEAYRQMIEDDPRVP